MDTSEVSIPSDIKSEVDSDRELVPDSESIKGSQGSARGPMVGPGRGPLTQERAVDPNDSLGDPVHSIKESSAGSEKSAVSGSQSQGIKPGIPVTLSPGIKPGDSNTPPQPSVKEFLLRLFERHRFTSKSFLSFCSF